MPEPSSKPDPPSPSASFYDVSDDEEGGYNTIAHTTLSRGVKLLYSKSKVYVHPTKSAKDNIPGFIALVQQKSTQSPTDERPTSADSSKKRSNSSSYLLAWVPESALSQDDLSTYVKVDMKDGESPPRQSFLVPPLPLATTFDESPVGPYAFSLPLSSIYSIHVRPPSLGWWYGSVVINTRAGSSLPALFFHDSECESTILQKKRRARESFDPFGESGDLYWGGDEVLRWLKRYVPVERSTAEPSIYLLDPTEEDLLGFGQGRKSMENQRKQGKSTSEQKKPSEQQKQPPGPGMDPLTKALKETRWKILEHLSKVTTFTRRTAEDLANNKNLPPQLRRILQNPEVQTWQDEYDSAKLYLAKWAASIAEQSDREKRQRIWTARDALDSEETSVGDFEILELEAGRMDLTGGKRRPVDLDEWRSFFDAKGSLHVTVDEVKERIFHGGLNAEDGVRKEAWPFLLGVYDWNSTEQERHVYMNGKRDEYVQLKGAWWERMADNEATPEQEEWWKEQKNRIEKDVHRTDRHIPLFAGEDIPHPDPTSPFYNADGPGTNVHMEQLKDMLLTYLEYDTPPSSAVAASSQPSSSTSPRRVYETQNPHPRNLGYVQGMSDLLSPLYAVFQDDALAFWAFVCFMRRMNRNFVRSQSGMRAQLATLDQLVQILDPKLYIHLQSADSTNFFFFFRMLLVWYKREFEWSDVLRLWESLWTDFYSSQFHLFVAMAILEKHRDFIMDHLQHFDEVLKYVNDLSGQIELQETLVRAEALFKRFEKTVEAVDRRNVFPAPGQTQGQSESGKQGGDGTSTQNANETGTRVTTSAAGSSRISGRQGSRPASQGRPTSSKGDTAPEKVKEKVITPELRLLLSKKIITLEGEDSNETDGSRTRASGLKD
ncbi:GTPase activating protein [Rhinocladiella similis]